jgi:hypothetical protein
MRIDKTTSKWKSIPGFPHYEACKEGFIKGYYGKILIPWVDGRGYCWLTLYEDGKKCRKSVHSLIALVFIGDYPTDDHQVNHKDLDKGNNHYKNLEYLTNQENMEHALLNGVKIGRSRKGEDNPSAKLTNKIVRKIRKYYKIGKYNQVELAEKYNISQAHVSTVIRNRVWKCV